jgi:hypothetical protein
MAMSSADRMANHMQSLDRVWSISDRHIAVMTLTVSGDTLTQGISW